MNDELITQNIEISALTNRNLALQADNASLVQRWLDKMNLTAEEMNHAFEKEQAVAVAVAVNGDKAKEGGKEDEDFQRGGKV